MRAARRARDPSQRLRPSQHARAAPDVDNPPYCCGTPRASCGERGGRNVDNSGDKMSPCVDALNTAPFLQRKVGNRPCGSPDAQPLVKDVDNMPILWTNLKVRMRFPGARHLP
ncbi:hypothetical protein HMPREF0058_0918 [Actinomyces urogenitalis DSM 15434]|uniref:Uncharacterized protein n=1 Tax=Actinomyces urogenitalis DSM 15434 TaxID=525246 RepID=C0W4X4_9ACTO|nr:hypothetical protein HMPREF0058_0918 [Actinomyces urogenitalis DSM 15434]